MQCHARSPVIYHLLYPLSDTLAGFNVLRYITFRAAMASLTAFFLSLILGPLLINQLKKFRASHSPDRIGFEAISRLNQEKSKTPTMGGVIIISAIVLSCLMWGDLSNRYLWISLAVLVWLGIVGFWDDYLKLRKQNAGGIRPMIKLICQSIAGIAVGLILYFESPGWSNVDIPFVKNWVITLGPLYILFVCCIFVGSSNAVNLTDGLDGLAIGCTTLIALTYAVFSYLTGHAVFANYLFMPFVDGAGELTVFCASLMGAGLGFLWFNCHPASVFMGDTGSLSIGGALGAVAVLTKKELLLLIVGGIFVVEALSVILQVASFKLTKKRIFKMAPIHHHFQLSGWVESKVVIRFWIIAGILSLVGLASLKLR